MTEDMGHENLIRVGIKVGFCLTDFTSRGRGMTLLARGTHLLPTPLTVDPVTNDPLEGVVELQLRAGDAFMFESEMPPKLLCVMLCRTARLANGK